MLRVVARNWLSAFMALFLFAYGAGVAFSATFATEALTIRKADGQIHRFTVELAITPDQRAQGLMHREEMAPDHGMLFDFGISRPVAMWMKNTHLPLDMLFIRQDGTIARIAADTVPFSEHIVDSGEPVLFVLELNAGTSARLAITAGDKVESHTIKAGTAEP